MDRRDYTFLVILALGCAMHLSLIVTSNLSNYNLYDTDTWCFVWMYSQWFHLSPLSTFNILALFPPILSALFSVSIYYLITRLYNKTVGFYAGVMFAISPGLLYLNSMFGMIDHHLIQVVLFTLSIVCLLLLYKERNVWWVIPIIISLICIRFTSPVLDEIYYGLFIVCAIICAVHYLITLRYYKMAVLTFVAVIASGFWLLQPLNIIPRATSWISWVEPITEIQPSDPIIFLIKFNTLLFVIILGVASFHHSDKDAPEIILIFLTVVLFIATLRFVRMEYIFAAPLMILSAYYIDKYFTRDISHSIIAIFLIISILFGCVITAEMMRTEINNEAWDGALKFISKEPNGLVLSHGDYGYWIKNANQTEFDNSAWGNALNGGKIFTSSNITAAKELITAHGISYIIVTERDMRYYEAQQFYAKSTTDYNESMLFKLIRGTSGYDAIYSKDGIIIYKT